MSTPKFTARFKGDPHKKECVACGQTKDRLKAFKPRWGKCSAHRLTTKRGEVVEGCQDCDDNRNSVVRQPRCVECDAARGKKKGKKVTPTTTAPAAKAPAKKKKPAKKKVAAKKVAVPVNIEVIEVPATDPVEAAVEAATAAEPITVTEEVPATETPELAKAVSSKDVLKQLVEDDDGPKTPSKAEEADSPF